MNDTDIFGAPTKTLADSDIFKDLPAKPMEKPEVKPEPTVGDRAIKTMLPIAQGLIKGGPMGMIAAGAHQAVSQGGEVLDRAAYNAGGAMTDMSSKYVPAEVAGGLGLAANVATQALPMVLGGEASRLATPVMQGAGRWLMQSAIKPPIDTVLSGKAAPAIESMLKEGINPTKGGMEVLQQKISALNDRIKAAISNSTSTVNKSKAASTLDEVASTFEKQANPKSDLSAIENALNEFLSHPLLTGKSEIPVQLAQEIKQGTYRALGQKSYGEIGTASTAAQKAIARGLKEEISAAVPEVSQLNKKESELLNVLNVAERRAQIEASKNPLNLALLTHNPLLFTGFMADKSALIKALLARGLYSGAAGVPSASRLGIGYLMMPQGNAEGTRPALDLR